MLRVLWHAKGVLHFKLGISKRDRMVIVIPSELMNFCFIRYTQTHTHPRTHAERGREEGYQFLFLCPGKTCLYCFRDNDQPNDVFMMTYYLYYFV